MNAITITISGPAGAGKSTLAQAIGRTLENVYGIGAIIQDEDGSSNNWEGERIEQCLEGLADRTTVVIRTEQAMRGGV